MKNTNYRPNKLKTGQGTDLQIFKPGSSGRTTGQCRSLLYRGKSSNRGKIPKTIAVDRFHVNCSGAIPELNETGEHIIMNDDVVLRFTKSTSQFKSFFEVFYCGEFFGEMLAHPHNEKFYRADHVRLEVGNHRLYGKAWVDDLLELADTMPLEIESVSRLDIAIDNLPFVIEFLNYFNKQSGENKEFIMKGRNPKSFKCNVLDTKSMQYANFQVGKANKKQFTVYNKTNEIFNKSNKEYILDFWKLNGLHIKDSKTAVFRCEIRLRSTDVNRLKEFAIQELENPSYLASIYQTMCKNFFEFAIVNPTDRNQNRFSIIELIPFGHFGGRLLQTVPRPLPDGRYKAQMTISGIAENYLRGRLDDDVVNLSFALVSQYIEKYNLSRWYREKLPKWLERWGDFSPNPEERIKLLEQPLYRHFVA